LQDGQREVFMLRLDKISFKEIAEIQNCSINTVLARMQYAMKNLKKGLIEWQTKD
jgi:RNA polymerase sigma-70 factor (ECF subfamily)